MQIHILFLTYTADVNGDKSKYASKHACGGHGWLYGWLYGLVFFFRYGIYRITYKPLGWSDNFIVVRSFAGHYDFRS